MSEQIEPNLSNDPPRKDRRPRDPERWGHREIDKYRRSKFALAFRPDAAFFELADPLVQSKRTLLGYDRLYSFWQAVRNLSNVPGDVAEIGTYRGGSAYFVASAFHASLGEHVPMHVFDTFEGHPSEAITQHDIHTAGQFNQTSFEDVREFLSPFPLLKLYKGDISTVLPTLPESVYRLVHLDTDLYQPTVDCLDYFGPRMSTGGVVVIDDYASPKCPGVPKALAEYMERTDIFQAWDLRTEQLLLVKR